MESVRLFARHELVGFEHLHARFERYSYARHAHADLVIGLVDQGLQSYTYRGSRHRTGRDGIFFVNAGEAHTGEPADDHGYTYRSVRIGAGFAAKLLGDRGICGLAFSEAVIHVPALAARLRAALVAVERGEAALRCEELILASLRSIAERHSEHGTVREYRVADPRAIDRVREFIRESAIEELSLARLAELAGLSISRFAHSFRRQVGCSPFAYAEALRMERAKSRLRAGAPLAEIALELGYSDQSHFTRKFRQHQGITPGRYAQAATRFADELTRRRDGAPARPRPPAGSAGHG